MDCEICKEPFNLTNKAPMQLPCCNETICNKCKEQLIASSVEDHFTCPLESCKLKSQSFAIFNENKALIKLLQKSVGIYCEIHQDKKAKYYCWNHDELVCQNCIVDFHKNHSTVGIGKKTLQNYNQIILSRLKAEVSRIQSLIMEIESYQNEQKQFSSKQYMDMMKEAYNSILINDEDQKRSMMFQNHLPQSIIPYIGTQFQSSLINDSDLTLIQSWFPSSIQLQLIYRASQHGFNSLEFHKQCDKEGPTLVFIKSEHNCIFGGFASESWQICGGFQQDQKAFIFSLTDKKKYDLKYGYYQQGKALCFRYDYGPTFGEGNTIYISSNCNQNRDSYSDAGFTYGTINKNQPFEQQTSQSIYLAGQKNFQVIEIEVFKVLFEQ